MSKKRSVLFEIKYSLKAVLALHYWFHHVERIYIKKKKWQHKEPERRTNETKEQNVKTILRLWILLYLNPEPPMDFEVT